LPSKSHAPTKTVEEQPMQQAMPGAGSQKSGQKAKILRRRSRLQVWELQLQSLLG
jgi:hypothetical protein